MSKVRTHPACPLAVVAIGAWLAACNFFTGSSGYEDVARCTGPKCGTCPAGQRWYAAGAICVADCSTNASPCGPACCSRQQTCVEEAGGTERCSQCKAAQLECGRTCCDQGAACLQGVCTSPYGVARQSCAGGFDCGSGASCCQSTAVPGGTFPQGAPESDSTASGTEKPERFVTVSSYSLDRFEVTVGRFRRFVDGWDYKALPGGAGAHPKVADSGWRAEWNKQLPTAPAEWSNLLEGRCGEYSTWHLSGGSPDSLLPVNCVSWYEAFAFCAWDGGRLPTEAEWEYATAGGGENRKYPWGATEPTGQLAVYGCMFGGTPGECAASDIAPVGSKPGGAGRWGHLDLAGGVVEWVLDAFDEYPASGGADYAKTDDVPVRVLRGGNWGYGASYLRASSRVQGAPWDPRDSYGVRCARDQ